MTGSSSTARRRTECGVTLMNNQVGYVVAQVMDGKKDVNVQRDLPSMIRVDGDQQDRLRLRRDRRGARLGRLRPGRLRGDHVDALRAHGRARRPRAAVRQPGGRGRVHRLRPPPGLEARADPCTRRTARSTSSSTATCTSGTRARRTGKARRSTARASSSASTPTTGLGPPEYALVDRAVPAATPRTTSMHDLFEDGYVDMAIFQPTYLRDFYRTGSTHRAERGARWSAIPGKFIVNGRWDPRDGEAGLRAARGRPRRALRASRASSSTRPSGRAPRAAGRSKDAEAVPLPREVPASSASRTSTSTRGRRSGRWTTTRFDVKDVDHAATRLPRPELHRRARRAAADRGLLLDRHAGAQRLRRPGGGHRRSSTRARATSRRCIGELLFWVGEDKMLFGRTTPSGSRSGWSRGSSTWTIPRT